MICSRTRIDSGVRLAIGFRLHDFDPLPGGLILFGKAIALRRYFPLHSVDYILIEGTDWITDDKDRYQTIEIREPLLLAIPRLVINARGFDRTKDKPKEQAASASLYFKELLYQKVRQFNPNYGESQEVLLKQLDNLSADIYGNRDFLTYLHNQGKYFYAAENRELDLKLIDYDNLSNNEYHVTEEYYINNSKYRNREDIVFLINSIPILVIECKNANKDEALQKFILRQHQSTAVEKVIDRCHDPKRKRGLVWHTQGSGKTFTTIKTAEMLFNLLAREVPRL